MFFKGSRYEKVPTLQHEDASGRVVSYKARREFPVPALVTRGHIVDEGERSDHIAFEHYRDPEVFWRICDANVIVFPEQLTAEPGTVLDIPQAGS